MLNVQTIILKKCVFYTHTYSYLGKNEPSLSHTLFLSPTHLIAPAKCHFCSCFLDERKKKRISVIYFHIEELFACAHQTQKYYTNNNQKFHLERDKEKKTYPSVFTMQHYMHEMWTNKTFNTKNENENEGQKKKKYK